MKIVVINPNSSEEMTRDIRKAAESYAAGRFEVLTLPTPGASKFIGTFEDMAKSAPGMCEIVRQSGAQLLGMGAVIEKEFQGGGSRLREAGVRLESLAVIRCIEDGVIHFR